MSDLLDDRPAPQRPGLTQVRSENLSHLVYESIRDAIINRSLPPGARLTETKLAEELNVSKTPVREALVKLREVGLIEPAGRRAERVIRPSRKTLEDAYDVRESLEVFASRRAAERATVEQAGAIREAAEDSLAGAREGDLARFGASDVAFHHAITAVTANRRLAELLDNAFALIVALRSRDLPDQETSIECGEAHVAIASAIATHDAAAAETSMRDHITHVRGFVIAQIDDPSEERTPS